MEDNNSSNGNLPGRSPNESLARPPLTVGVSSKPPSSKSYHHHEANNKKNGKAAPHVEDAAAREAHDIFNLVALVGRSSTAPPIPFCFRSHSYRYSLCSFLSRYSSLSSKPRLSIGI
jgi:hypothetical protein